MENAENNTLSKIAYGVKNSIMFKLASIGIIALILLIPASSIESLIHERQQRRDMAILEVSSKWGSEQILAGPILNVPYISYYKNTAGEVKQSMHYAHFLPEQLSIAGNIIPETRKRGIYEIVLYNSTLNFSGSFEKPDFSLLSVPPENIRWNEAYIAIGITDMTGIQKNLSLDWNGELKVVEAGLPEHEVISSGLISRVNIVETDTYNFNFNIDLNGSSQISFVPVGKKTLVKLKSPWPNPSFNGSFIPDDHDISEAGFTAEWEILDVNRNFPQQWLGKSQSINEAAFGLSLILPVNEYQKNMRSVKYALLVIALTFLIFFLIEILNKKKFHPFQYIMVGTAIVLFYSLLISFTEHMGFNVAYVLSAVLVVGLITIYVRAVFNHKRLTVLVSSLLSIIYGFIFVILQLQDFALLVGSLGLFAALASLMYLSRNIDWYELRTKPQAKNT